MRALRGMVVGVLLLLTGCVAYGPQPAAYGYGYGPSYSYSPVYVAPVPTIVVPVVRYPQYRPYGHRRWRG
ncbi:MAG: hypothetical protein ACOYMH_01365 [Zwartia sp.]|jgi:hypothetical protein